MFWKNNSYPSTIDEQTSLSSNSKHSKDLKGLWEGSTAQKHLDHPSFRLCCKSMSVRACPSTLSTVSFFLPSKRKRSSPFLKLFLHVQKDATYRPALGPCPMCSSWGTCAGQKAEGTVCICGPRWGSTGHVGQWSELVNYSTISGFSKSIWREWLSTSPPKRSIFHNFLQPEQIWTVSEHLRTLLQPNCS